LDGEATKRNENPHPRCHLDLPDLSGLARFLFHQPIPQTMKTKFILIAVSLAITSCGGTFTLRPDGSLAYTTPEILKAPIVYEK
jgi:hypothetical protein